jgi:DNA-binding protein HU-beta
LEGGIQMIKAELIEKLAKDAKISKVAAGAALNSFTDGIAKALTRRDGKVTLVGFGTFKKVYQNTRNMRNSQTGEQKKTKGRNTVTFKASKMLRDRI